MPKRKLEAEAPVPKRPRAQFEDLVPAGPCGAAEAAAAATALRARFPHLGSDPPGTTLAKLLARACGDPADVSWSRERLIEVLRQWIEAY